MVRTINPVEPPQPSLFSGNYVLEETYPSELSSSPDLWLNSGAYLHVENGQARTVFGPLDENDKWRISYEDYNSGSTDGGYYPQNIFRLLTRKSYLDSSQELTFNINKLNLSSDEHRNESNGVLLFMRYVDQDNLYYAGLRVDGAYVIKRKFNGEYSTLASKEVFTGNYDKEFNPSLIQTNENLFIKTTIKTLPNGNPHIQLFAKNTSKASWQLILEHTDLDLQAIKSPGSNGIRTDFMDVTFVDYKLLSL